MRQTGTCHCGRVTFTVDVPEDMRPHRCNCSICTLKGSVSIDVPHDALAITAGEDALSLYTFNTHLAQHWFCGTCGIHVYHQLRSDPAKVAINGACVAGLGPYDFSQMPVHDGRDAHPKDTGRPTRIAGMMRYESKRD